MEFLCETFDQVFCLPGYYRTFVDCGRVNLDTLDSQLDDGLVPTFGLKKKQTKQTKQTIIIRIRIRKNNSKKKRKKKETESPPVPWPVIWGIGIKSMPTMKMSALN